MSSISTPVSAKVTAGTLATFGAGLVIAILGAIAADPRLVEFLPDPVAVLLVAVIPAVCAFLAGYKTTDPLRYPNVPLGTADGHLDGEAAYDDDGHEYPWGPPAAGSGGSVPI